MKSNKQPLNGPNICAKTTMFRMFCFKIVAVQGTLRLDIEHMVHVFFFFIVLHFGRVWLCTNI